MPLRPNFSQVCTVGKEHHVSARPTLPEIPLLVYRKCGRRTLEAGRDTGSNAKFLILVSCKHDFWSVTDNSFSFSSSLHANVCGEAVPKLLRLSGSISWLTEAKRTDGDPSAAFLDSGVDAMLRRESVQERTVRWVPLSVFCCQGRNQFQSKQQATYHQTLRAPGSLEPPFRKMSRIGASWYRCARMI